MKRILITGAGSYVGTAVESYLARWPERYRVDTVDMERPDWRETSFAGYDAVFHVAGVAHSDTGRLTRSQKDHYYRVNTDLAIETAQKAKADGAKQFIFMSTAVVYGDSAPIGAVKTITRDTPLAPANVYADSKVRAEQGLQPLDGPDFKLVILRPPLIYGPGCRGNYPVLARLARTLPLFPEVPNRRSMLYIGNFAEFLRLMVENGERGIFFPQNREYVNTTELARLIAAAHGKRLVTVPGFAWALKLLSHATALVNKAFGSLCYDQALSQYPQEYRLTSLADSIRETEEAV